MEPGGGGVPGSWEGVVIEWGGPNQMWGPRTVGGGGGGPNTMGGFQRNLGGSQGRGGGGGGGFQWNGGGSQGKGGGIQPNVGSQDRGEGGS